MKVGIIGYGSMGKMILEKIAEAKFVECKDLYAANRTYEKIEHLTAVYNVCKTNAELAAAADIIFICVRPADIRTILNEIKPLISKNTLIVSLNGSITFEMMSKIIDHKIAKAIPSVTAEINRPKTLICCSSLFSDDDRIALEDLLKCMGDVIELPEEEIGMGSEPVSCMPGFISAIFDVISNSAKKHTNISEQQIIQMLLHTMVGTGNLMLEKCLSFNDVVARVAAKGGITEEGTKVIYDMLPKVTDEMFDKTLEKRIQTAEKARDNFEQINSI